MCRIKHLYFSRATAVFFGSVHSSHLSLVACASSDPKYTACWIHRGSPPCDSGSKCQTMLQFSRRRTETAHYCGRVCLLCSHLPKAGRCAGIRFKLSKHCIRERTCRIGAKVFFVARVLAEHLQHALCWFFL